MKPLLFVKKGSLVSYNGSGELLFERPQTRQVKLPDIKASFRTSDDYPELRKCLKREDLFEFATIKSWDSLISFIERYGCLYELLGGTDYSFNSSYYSSGYYVLPGASSPSSDFKTHSSWLRGSYDRTSFSDRETLRENTEYPTEHITEWLRAVYTVRNTLSILYAYQNLDKIQTTTVYCSDFSLPRKEQKKTLDEFIYYFDDVLLFDIYPLIDDSALDSYAEWLSETEMNYWHNLPECLDGYMPLNYFEFPDIVEAFDAIECLDEEELQDFNELLDSTASGIITPLSEELLLAITLKTIVNAHLHRTDNYGKLGYDLKMVEMKLSLLQALWQMFARFIDEELHVGICEFCGDPFDASKAHGTARKFCSDSCKSQSSRKKT